MMLPSIALAVAVTASPAAEPVARQELVWGHFSTFGGPPGLGGISIDVFRVNQLKQTFWILRKKESAYPRGKPSTITWIDSRKCPASLSVLRSTQDLKQFKGFTGPPVLNDASYAVKTIAQYPDARGSDATDSEGNSGGPTEAWFDKELPLLASCWRDQSPADVKLPDTTGPAGRPSF
jgi:hypothetical protein